MPLRTLTDKPTTLADLADDKVVLLVNVASECGLTPQYSGLVGLQQTYGPQGFTVVGVPCNQFMGQEPGRPRRSPNSVPPLTEWTSRCWRRAR